MQFERWILVFIPIVRGSYTFVEFGLCLWGYFCFSLLFGC